jgi:hypothetical protein
MHTSYLFCETVFMELVHKPCVSILDYVHGSAHMCVLLGSFQGKNH